MWHHLFKKQITKTNLLQIIELEMLHSKLRLIDEFKSNKVIINFNLLKVFFNPFFNLYNLNFLLNTYTNFLITLDHLSLKLYNTIILIKLTKKQSFSHILIKNKIKLFFTNGMLLKKLSITKKSQKKDLKVSLLNVKNTVDSGFVKDSKNIIVNIVNTKVETIKIAHLLRFMLKGKNILYIYTPLTFFSKNRFKKIQSIKRKLKKKYNAL